MGVGEIDFDVAIVGYGPVGQALAIALGRAGHRVAVFERFDTPYRLPRAVHIDHEVMRLLQRLGVADELAEEMLAVYEYQWFGADGEPLLTLRPQLPALSGWEPDYLFFQPALEAVLERAAQAEPTVEVSRGCTVEALDDTGELVLLSVRDAAGLRTIGARWVIGADGANSFVREAAGIGQRDLGFQEQWLVVDVEPHDIDALAHLPAACQWCDPRRPTTHVLSGTGRRRWEFMLLPGEQPEQFAQTDRTWELLAPWCTPEQAELTRSTVYQFRSLLAEAMRRGRLLLAGDAAHLTPPFMGQGLCTGIRDAANLAWKLDLVLRGQAGDGLLDSVERERQPQNEWIIAFAVELGRVLCELDPEAAAERDRTMRAAGDPPPLQFAPLADGLIHRGPDGTPGLLAGQLSLQGRVAGPHGDGLFDDAVGGSFALIAADGNPPELLSERQRAFLQTLNCRVVSLESAAWCGVRDLDGRLGAWLSEHGAHAVLVRPDLYVFGAASSAVEVPTLIDDLHAQLGVHNHAILA